MVSGESAVNADAAVVWPVPPCEIAAAPETLPNPGCRQLALPLVEIPVAQLLLPHWTGVDTRAVAVAALPVVLLKIVVGRSLGESGRNDGVAACPESGPARIVLAVWVRSCGASVPNDVIGEPETVGLKMMPSPFIPTLVTDPEPITPFETKILRTSVIEEITVLLVTTVAMGMVVALKPVVFDAGAQLLAVLRYT